MQLMTASFPDLLFQADLLKLKLQPKSVSARKFKHQQQQKNKEGFLIHNSLYTLNSQH